jgi:pyruvate-formate lyase-activating enzyme
MDGALDQSQLYRLPWTLPDNAINWLEPTSACNLRCDGCYRKNTPNGHKPLDVVRRELETFNRLRRTDGVSIAGGDPLLHPEIEQIVAMVAGMGQKPIINTNGLALTPEKLRALKRAGVVGFTFHIDSGQDRPEMRGKSEVELNDLRLRYACMLAEVGGVSCAFNATVYPHTLQDVPAIVAWGQEHIDIVHTLVFIAYRAVPVTEGYDYMVGGRKVDAGRLAFYSQPTRRDILSTDVVAEIRKACPEFMPSAYLNGTERPDQFKWLLTMRVGTKRKIYGYLGPKLIEVAQVLHHLTRGTYLAYMKPGTLGRGRSLLLLSPLDRGVRRTAGAYLRGLLASPGQLFSRLRLQAVMIIQPADFMANGALSMCDGCPDITVHEGRLVWSCRLEELVTFGDWVRPVVTPSAAEAAAPPAGLPQ